MTTSKTWCHVRCVLFSRSFMNTSLNCAPNMNSMDIKSQRYYQGCNDQIKKKVFIYIYIYFTNLSLAMFSLS